MKLLSYEGVSREQGNLKPDCLSDAINCVPTFLELET